MRFKIFSIPKHLREGILVSGSNESIRINPNGAVIHLDIESIKLFGSAKIQHHEGVKCSSHHPIGIVKTVLLDWHNQDDIAQLA
jgi:hypothetical protein